MESSCIDESSIESNYMSKPTEDGLKPPPKGLQRMGSGRSVVIDAIESGVEAESRKLPSSKFKGVVPQPNGRWGAQLYEKHRRVWLGTFNEETVAAKAYDIAAQRFRGRDAVTNFKPISDSDDLVQALFLNSHSKAEIVDMLRKHTYCDELQQCRRNHAALTDASTEQSRKSTGASERETQQLFNKALTPSDVGKLNRLVIPKQHAEKHFPPHVGSACKGVLLNFEDAQGKVWKFRYSYWNSSQSYVLTKGWSRFVKEKGLKAGDVVSFHRLTGTDTQLYIDCKAQPNIASFLVPSQLPSVQVVRLFGVNIFNIAPSNVVDKRSREKDYLLPHEYCLKKPCIGAL